MNTCMQMTLILALLVIGSTSCEHVKDSELVIYGNGNKLMINFIGDARLMVCCFLIGTWPLEYSRIGRAFTVVGSR